MWLTHPPIQWVPSDSRGHSGRALALSTHPHVTPRLKEKYSYISTPLCAFMAGYKVNFTFTFNFYDKIDADWCTVTNVSNEIHASVHKVLDCLEDGVSKLHCTVQHVQEQIDLQWVRAFTVPRHLGLTDRPFVPHNLISTQESPVPLPKFQMAPRLKILMPCGSKKGTQIYYDGSQA